MRRGQNAYPNGYDCIFFSQRRKEAGTKTGPVLEFSSPAELLLTFRLLQSNCGQAFLCARSGAAEFPAPWRQTIAWLASSDCPSNVKSPPGRLMRLGHTRASESASPGFDQPAD